jgi:protoporphyrinogen oxidase
MKIAIIGAGIGGMAAAFDLVRAGYTVDIYESAGYVGGLAAGFKDPAWDWSVEYFYHHWFESDADMWKLMKELGLYENRVVRRPVTVMFFKEKFYPFDSIPAALLYPGLGWGLNKIRFGFVGLYLRLSQKWPIFEKFTVNDWMRKWAGDKVYEEMWEPMMIGKFGERYANVVNMAWFWARLHTRTPRLVTYKGGFQAFSDQFAEKLRGLGVTIHLSTPIQSITPCAEGGVELTTSQGAVKYDQALVTTSPALLARMAPALPQNYLKGLLDLKSIGAVVVTLALKHQLSKEGYYWFNLPKSAGFPFLALVEHTNFLTPEYFNGDHILYIGDYLDPEHEFFRLSKDEIVERYLPSLKRFNPDFQPDWVRASWMYRTTYAQPVPLVNHSQNIPAIRTPLQGLYFASMSQVYPWDRGTNFAVRIAREAAGMMLADGK